MAVKLRLRRQGRKGRPYYHIVAADSRAPRDGKFLEKVGSYNPIADPAEIIVDHDLAIKWLRNGAQPSDTVRSILRHVGVNLKYALIKQGKSEDEVNAVYSRWEEEKAGKVAAQETEIREKGQSARKEALAHESKVRAAKAAEVSAKYGKAVEEAAAAEEAKEAPAAKVEAPAAEEATEAPAAEVEAPAAEEKTEAPAAEVEAPAAEEKTEAPAAEVEAPAAEEAAPETPAAEADAPAEEAKEDSTPAEEKK